MQAAQLLAVLQALPVSAFSAASADYSSALTPWPLSSPSGASDPLYLQSLKPVQAGRVRRTDRRALRRDMLFHQLHMQDSPPSVPLCLPADDPFSAGGADPVQRAGPLLKSVLPHGRQAFPPARRTDKKEPPFRPRRKCRKGGDKPNRVIAFPEGKPVR